MVRCEVLGNPVQYPDFAILKSERVVIERVALPLLSVENVEPLEPVFALGYPGTADSLNGNQYCYADIDGVNATSGTVTRMEKLAGCEDMERQYSDRRKFRTVILSGLVRRSFCSSRSATKGSTGMNKQTVWIWHIPWGIEFPLSPWTLGCAVLLFLGILEAVLQETQGAEENQKAENVQKKLPKQRPKGGERAKGARTENEGKSKRKKRRRFSGSDIFRTLCIFCLRRIRMIGEYAFTNCRILNNVTIREGFQRIEDGAFSSCTNLTNIAFPETLTAIGVFAFAETSLDSVFIPSRVEEIGAGLLKI